MQPASASHYRERDVNSNLTQPPPSASSHYRDANGMPVTSSGLQSYHDRRHPSHPPPSASAGQAHPSSSSKNSRGLPYARPDKDYQTLYKELKVKVNDVEMVCVSCRVGPQQLINSHDRKTIDCITKYCKQNATFSAQNSRERMCQASDIRQLTDKRIRILYERLGQLPASPIPTNAALPAPFAPPADYPPSSRRRERDHYYQQPIQPAPASASHTSPPIVHEHQGQIPITHAQQLITVNLPEGPALVVAGPDGRPVFEHGRYIFANELHGGGPVPPPTSAPPKRRGGRVSKEVREMREREAARMREREMQDAAVVMTDMRASQPAPPPSQQTVTSVGEPPSAGSGNPPPQSASSSRSHSAAQQQQYVDLDWERERLEREKVDARERDKYPERGSSPPVHSSHRHRHHAHVHRSHSHHDSASPMSPSAPPPQPQSSHRIHGHQRIGPGSYVIRDAPSPPPLPNEEQPAPAIEGVPPTAGSRSVSGSPA